MKKKNWEMRNYSHLILKSWQEKPTYQKNKKTYNCQTLHLPFDSWNNSFKVLRYLVPGFSCYPGFVSDPSGNHVIYSNVNTATMVLQEFNRHFHGHKTLFPWLHIY